MPKHILRATGGLKGVNIEIDVDGPSEPAPPPGKWVRGYTPMPNSLATSGRLRFLAGSDFKVYHAIASHYHADKPRFKVARSKIAAMTGVHPRNVSLSIAKLVEVGLLRIVSAGNGHESSVYELTEPPVEDVADPENEVDMTGGGEITAPGKNTAPGKLTAPGRNTGGGDGAPAGVAAARPQGARQDSHSSNNLEDSLREYTEWALERMTGNQYGMNPKQARGFLQMHDVRFVVRMIAYTDAQWKKARRTDSRGGYLTNALRARGRWSPSEKVKQEFVSRFPALRGAIYQQDADQQIDVGDDGEGPRARLATVDQAARAKVWVKLCEWYAENKPDFYDRVVSKIADPMTDQRAQMFILDYLDKTTPTSVKERMSGR